MNTTTATKKTAREFSVCVSSGMEVSTTTFTATKAEALRIAKSLITPGSSVTLYNSDRQIWEGSYAY